MSQPVTYSRSAIEPNDWVEYVDAQTGEVLHVDAFRNPARTTSRPGMINKMKDFKQADVAREP